MIVLTKTGGKLVAQGTKEYLVEISGLVFIYYLSLLSMMILLRGVAVFKIFFLFHFVQASFNFVIKSNC